MVEYKCTRCNKTFNRKSNFIYHLNKVKPCVIYENTLLCSIIKENIKVRSSNVIPSKCPPLSLQKLSKNEEIICEFCNRSFKRKDNLKRHLYICKQKKEHEIQNKDNQLKEELFLNLVKEVELMKKEHKNELEKIQKQNTKLQDEIKNLKASKIINNTNCNNTNNTINQTINILSYKNTDISHITFGDYIKCLDRANYCVPQLLEAIHFNPNKPENHNIYIPNLKNNLIMLYDGESWNLHNRDDTIEEIYEDKTNILVDKVDDWEKIGKNINEIALRKFNRYLGKKDTPGISNKIKDEIKLILYNKREMIRNK